MSVYNKKELLACGECVNFRRHYSLDGERYYALQFGHCVFPRCKDRREDQTCPRWEARVIPVPPASAAGPETPPAGGR